MTVRLILIVVAIRLRTGSILVSGRATDRAAASATHAQGTKADVNGGRLCWLLRSYYGRRVFAEAGPGSCTSDERPFNEAWASSPRLFIPAGESEVVPLINLALLVASVSEAPVTLQMHHPMDAGHSDRQASIAF
jgi:hypothetical protein